MREEAEKAKKATSIDAVKEIHHNENEMNEKGAKEIENEETNDAAKAAHENEIAKNEMSDDNDIVYVDEREEKSRRNEMTFMLRSNEFIMANTNSVRNAPHRSLNSCCILYHSKGSLTKAKANDKRWRDQASCRTRP